MRYKTGLKTLVAIDCIIFGFDADELQLLLIKRGFEPEQVKWSLMGGFLEDKETLDQAGNRILQKLTGLQNVYMEQLKAFSSIARDPIERTISVAYFALINSADHNKEITSDNSAEWFSVKDHPALISDHDTMVDGAVKQLQYSTSAKPLVFELLSEKFTMRKIRKLYEAILNELIDKRNLAKRINALNILEKLDEKDLSSSKKGSWRYRFDSIKYQKRLTEGMTFRL